MAKFRGGYFVGLVALLVFAPSVSLASPMTDSILMGVNLERAKVGVGALKQDEELNKIAKDRIQDMIKYRYFAHINPTSGEKYSDFFPTPRPEYFGEILARRFRSSEAVVDGWMNSPTHKKAMLRDSYTKTGIAVKKGMVVQVFSD